MKVTKRSKIYSLNVDYGQGTKLLSVSTSFSQLIGKSLDTILRNELGMQGLTDYQRLELAKYNHLMLITDSGQGVLLEIIDWENI